MWGGPFSFVLFFYLGGERQIKAVQNTNYFLGCKCEAKSGALRRKLLAI